MKSSNKRQLLNLLDVLHDWRLQSPIKLFNNDHTSHNVNENVDDSKKQLGNEPAIKILAEPQKQNP